MWLTFVVQVCSLIFPNNNPCYFKNEVKISPKYGENYTVKMAIH
jgi:hypothetical protein